MLSILKLGEVSQPSAQTRSKAVYCLSNSLKHNAQAVRQFGNLGGWDVLREALNGSYYLGLQYTSVYMTTTIVESSSEDSSIAVRRKVAFLLTALILQDDNSDPEDEKIQLPPSIHANLPAPVPSEAETSTNGRTSKAILSSGILISLLKSIKTPVPHGPDGSEIEADLDYEEKGIKTVLAFVQLGAEKLTDKEKQLLSEVLSKFGKSKGLERWSLTDAEWNQLENASRT